MVNLYNEFEKRFTNSWFSAGWVEVEKKQEEQSVTRKDLTTLEAELDDLKEKMESISLKKLQLSNLAKLYSE